MVSGDWNKPETKHWERAARAGEAGHMLDDSDPNPSENVACALTLQLGTSPIYTKAMKNQACFKANQVW